MELTARDFERIPRTNLHVPVREFARLWLAAERRGDALAAEGRGDWYLTGVQMTCSWLACAFVTFNYPSGPVKQRARAPITRGTTKAYEELIAAEAEAAERAVARGGLPGRPGLAEGAMATLAWTWLRSGVPPIDIEHAQAG
ncbi:hypothetical protein JOF29_005711 [Kribbella aluminosa]|uniref:Uncharacterized protein n=1 Tax=Kribbella aluminosa TaxID=416017 RepID=A0ABS4USK6_9ACTN|nr:hypothetical protein [Kribbella aluminosa]MBP2354601.1 hypothetical protein [Kribbella aluminosa]